MQQNSSVSERPNVIKYVTSLTACLVSMFYLVVPWGVWLKCVPRSLAEIFFPPSSKQSTHQQPSNCARRKPITIMYCRGNKKSTRIIRYDLTSPFICAVISQLYTCVVCKRGFYFLLGTIKFFDLGSEYFSTYLDTRPSSWGMPTLKLASSLSITQRVSIFVSLLVKISKW